MEGAAVTKKKAAKKKAAKKKKAAPKRRATTKKAKRHPATADLPERYLFAQGLDVPLPDVWRRRPPPPACVRCRAQWNSHAGQAVKCYGIAPRQVLEAGELVEEEHAYLQCTVCGHKFCLPVEPS